MQPTNQGKITIGWRGAIEPIIALAKELDNDRAVIAMTKAVAEPTRRGSFNACMDALRALVEHRCALQQVPSEQQQAAKASAGKLQQLELRLWPVIWEIACGAP